MIKLTIGSLYINTDTKSIVRFNRFINHKDYKEDIRIDYSYYKYDEEHNNKGDSITFFGPENYKMLDSNNIMYINSDKIINKLVAVDKITKLGRLLYNLPTDVEKLCEQLRRD